MPTEYKTLVTGITGTGKPFTDKADVAVEDNKQNIQMPTNGNTFTGMCVTDTIKEQIEQSTASYFLDCQKRDDEKYDLIPTLPEFGCDVDGGEVYKLRENHNRLMKGIAQKFLNADGNFDYKAGKNFISEMESRFNSYASTEIDPDNPYANTSRGNMEWLCNELNIPAEERNDFTNYCKANITTCDEAKNFGTGNFYNIWSGYADKFEAAKILQSEQKLSAQQFDQVNQELQNTTEKVKQLAAMDPKNQKEALNITDCEGNSHITTKYLKQAIMADQKKNNPPKIGSDLANDIFSSRWEPEEGKTLKWETHFAPVIGKITDNGKTYYLTLETIAPSASQLANDTAVSKPGIGLYRDMKDFCDSYTKDIFVPDAQKGYADTLFDAKNDVQSGKKAPEPPQEPILTDFEIIEVKTPDLSNLSMETRNAMRTKYTEKENEVNGKTTDAFVKAKPPLKQADTNRKFVPDEYKGIYDTFASALNSASRKNEQWEKSRMIHEKMVSDYQAEYQSQLDGRSLFQKLRGIRPDSEKLDFAREMKNFADYKKSVADVEMSALTKAMDCMIDGKQPNTVLNERELKVLESVKKKNGITDEKWNACQNALKQHKEISTFARNSSAEAQIDALNPDNDLRTQKMGLAKMIAAKVCMTEYNKNPLTSQIDSIEKMNSTIEKSAKEVLDSEAFKHLTDVKHKNEPISRLAGRGIEFAVSEFKQCEYDVSIQTRERSKNVVIPPNPQKQTEKTVTNPLHK